jgi:hypothetical protein
MLRTSKIVEKARNMRNCEWISVDSEQQGGWDTNSPGGGAQST